MKEHSKDDSAKDRGEELPIEEIDGLIATRDWNAIAWKRILAQQEANLREGKPLADWYTKPRIWLETMTPCPSYKDEYLAALADKKQSLADSLSEKPTTTLVAVLKVCIHEEQDAELQELITIELKRRTAKNKDI